MSLTILLFQSFKTNFDTSFNSRRTYILCHVEHFDLHNKNNNRLVVDLINLFQSCSIQHAPPWGQGSISLMQNLKSSTKSRTKFLSLYCSAFSLATTLFVIFSGIQVVVPKSLHIIALHHNYFMFYDLHTFGWDFFKQLLHLWSTFKSPVTAKHILEFCHSARLQSCGSM